MTPGQASYVLERLIGDRRISRGEVNRYVGEISREIDSLERRLSLLRDASAAARGRRAGRPPGPAAARPGRSARRRRGRRAAVTPERRASQQLQGRYLGLIRQIPATRRAHYAKVAKDKGREAAIKEMASALGR